MLNILRRIFGSRNDRLVKALGPDVSKAASFEPPLERLDDAQLQAKTDEFRRRLAQGETLNQLLPEAFAVVREASRRTLHMRHFDVQLIGGIALHQGKIAEMRTGEGKTLVATLPAYLNAIGGQGVHIVTVNEYLAQRDSDWMGPVFKFLGLSVGVIRNSQSSVEKRAAYACDITYGTNNEFGFDYLRDNLAFQLQERVQRGLSFAVVDEVDSILIDEARTPLIISGPAEETIEIYAAINDLIPRLKRQKETDGKGDFWVDEKQRQVHLSEEGHEHVEQLMIESTLLSEGQSLYDPGNIRLMHHLNAALRAHVIYKRDVEYIVRGGEVIIVDEFTGRTMPGRRWSEGLHQAVEAKERVQVREENQTIASITFQNFFRLYKKLSGMTGTADTEAPEFMQIYGLEVMVIPTHRPMVRGDLADLVYLTQSDKFQAIVADIRDCATRAQPVLVGTTSIETSELISEVLTKEGIEHRVLNAKQHDKEAQVVAQAGVPAAVTIATNMAGRGTDIVLGGSFEAELYALEVQNDIDLSSTNAEGKSRVSDKQRATLLAQWQIRHDQVLAAGGLHIIGTERHESRRIDNQLRGRSGRQGDPGSSRFYLSMEDNLMRIFGDPNFTKRLLTAAGMKEGEVIESRMLSKRIETAQRKVESHNFDIRKQLLLFDDVANDQRKVIYQQRTEIMGAQDLSSAIRGIQSDVLVKVLDDCLPRNVPHEDWDLEAMRETIAKDFNALIEPRKWLEAEPEMDEEVLRQRIAESVAKSYDIKSVRYGLELMQHLEKDIMLRTLDQHWREHLAAMDYLRQGIHLRSYAQKDYRYEYKREAYELFSQMLDRVKFDTASVLTRVEVRNEAELQREEESRQRRLMQALQVQHVKAESALVREQLGLAESLPRLAQAGTFTRSDRKVGRNEVCHCGSGKKYKHCHGALED
ncbi:MAG: preprotein translocase subunit SecA [Gammaproteobacteria bacterium]|nr:preprotein translocase subunit SecA [Gammaproteobacteria bacterium]